MAGAGTEAIKDNRGEGTGENANAQEGFQKKETKKEREARIKQEELEQDAWAEADLPSTDSDDWDTQELWVYLVRQLICLSSI